MNELIRQLARPNLMYERWTKYGESIEEEYYDFDPEELQEFILRIVHETASWINENVGMIDEDARADLYKHFGVE